jgi:hypothetical protein
MTSSAMTSPAMTNAVKIILKREPALLDGMKLEELEGEIKEVQGTKERVPGCEGVYYEITSDFDGQLEGDYWVYYRWETSEEAKARKEKALAAVKKQKEDYFYKLKEELGL